MLIFNDCQIERIIDYKNQIMGYKIIVPANKNKGFNFPYILFIPDGATNQTTLIVEGPNAKNSKENIEDAIQVVINESIYRAIFKWNTRTNYPILTPAFPRLITEDGAINTHMLTSQALNYQKYGLERIDNQLLKMIEDASKRLLMNNITIDEKVILDGYSASALFANRFALLHPEIIKTVIAGATSGALIIPEKHWQGETLLYPIGCGNINGITDEKRALFKSIPQFYYMGKMDTQNDPFEADDKGTPIYSSIIKKEEAQQLYKFVGKQMMPDRWNNIGLIYKKLGINATFKTYPSIGHAISSRK